MKQFGITKFDAEKLLKDLNLEKSNNGVPIVTVGADIGNGWIKGRSSASVQVLLPSSYALPFDSNLVDADNGLKPSSKLHFFRSKKYNLDTDIDYLIGEDVLKAESPISTFSHNRRYTNEDYLMVTEFAIVLLLGKFAKKNPDVVLTVGVPSKDKIDKNVDDLKNELLGKHTVIHNGKEVTFNVIFVDVQTQPMGSHANFIIDSVKNTWNINFTIGKEKFGNLRNTHYGLADFGNHTVDLEGILEGKANIRERKTLLGFGMRDIYEHLAKVVNEDETLGIHHTADSVEGYLDENWIFRQNEGVKDLKKEMDDFLKNRAIALKTSILASFPQRKVMKKIFLVGGGSEVWGPFLKAIDEDNKFVIVPYPQMSNAYGFLKLSHFRLERMFKARSKDKGGSE
ncbi:hypothetical protein [Lysinibacillus xylanilyticus]|uniref:Actin-like protein N-terminal domain-containing protein n=1 Tax=Lysinibacillus xylanilyticus TaxID=582475 RepID=A0ABV3W0C2_9BACI